MFEDYESEADLSIYLQFHYGGPQDGFAKEFGWPDFGNFNAEVVRTMVETGPARSVPRSALDLGCGMGRAAFELSRHFDSVLAVDRSRKFIESARTLAAKGRLEFRRMTLGRGFEIATAQLPEAVHADRVEFVAGDATDSRILTRTFDCVLALNLLCRLKEPQKLLAALPSLVVPGGQLVMATPWSWNPGLTPQEDWIDGAAAGTEPLVELERRLAPWFQCERRVNLPFLMQETTRKYGCSVSQVTSWRRTAEAV